MTLVLQVPMRLTISYAMNARLALFLQGAVTHVQHAKLDHKRQNQAASCANHVQQAPTQGKPAQNADRVLQEPFQINPVEPVVNAVLAVLPNHP